jgi:glutamyl/glutaminyl-tRNA synthetase
MGLPFPGTPIAPDESTARALLSQLRDDHLVYACACEGPECLAGCSSLDLPRGAALGYRLRAPSHPIRVHDLTRGILSLPADTVEGLCLADLQGRPSPLWLAASTEHAQRITDLVMAQEDLRGLALRGFLYEFAGAPPPRVLFAPPLSPLSPDPSISALRQEGFLAAAVVNALALLGWTPPEGAEALSWELLLLLYEPSSLPGLVQLDLGRLRALNQAHLRALSFEDLAEALRPFVERAGLLEKSPDLMRWARLVREEISTLAEVNSLAYLVDAASASPEGAPDDARLVLAEPGAAAVLDAAALHLSTGDEDFHNLRAFVEAETKAKRKHLFLPLRAALTGQLRGPPLPEILPLLGAPEGVRRINAWRDWLRSLR